MFSAYNTVNSNINVCAMRYLQCENLMAQFKGYNVDLCLKLKIKAAK